MKSLTESIIKTIPVGVFAFDANNNLLYKKR